MAEVVLLKNPDGTVSSELTITVEATELNSGRPTLIPTIVDGKRLSDNEAIKRAIRSGRSYPSFGSIAEAGRFARERSRKGGAGTQGLLGKIMAHAKEPLTRGTKKGGSELTERGKTKLHAQIVRAERIMRVEGKRKSTGEVYRTAARMRRRAQELLGGHHTPEKSASPGKSESKSDVHAERRRRFEKAMPGDPAGKLREIERKTRNRATLIGVAKRANKANRGE